MSDMDQSSYLARLREVVADLGTQKEAAEKTGIAYATLQRILAGKTEAGFKRLEMIAAAAGLSVDQIVPPNFFQNESRAFQPFPSLPLQRVEQANLDRDLVEVREIDLKFGMGATDLEIPVTTTVRHFSRDWVRQYTRASPDKLYFAEGIGDSMAPTISDHDLLLIDTSERSVRMADKVWAVSYSGAGMVKRLRPTREGVQILSDNPLVPAETAYDGELHILGRVVGIFRRL